MVELKKLKGIYLYPDTVDFRMGIVSLTNLILTNYKEDEVRDCLFVFFGTNKRHIKMIEINDDGTWLYQKKLNSSSFLLPQVGDSVKIDKKQLLAILNTIKGKKIK